MQAVILVGGRGTRLGQLGKDTPKPLLPVANRPFLTWLITNLERFGVDEILLLAGHQGQQVVDFASSWSGRARIACLIETEPLGTAGALRNAANALDAKFFLLNGDSLFDINILDLAINVPPTALAGLALRAVPDAGRYGTVTVKNGIVIDFAEKEKTGPGLIYGGVSLLRRSILSLLPERGSIEREVFPRMLDGRLVAREYRSFFIDIGVPADYARAQQALPAHFRRPAVFLDRDGVINEDTGYVHRPEQFRWLPEAIPTIKQLNDLGFLVIVITNQAGIARGLYCAADVNRLHNWLNDELRQRGAHIDAFYFCPHHPEFTGPCTCRKPEPGLILQAARDWNIDLERSIGYGDKPTDSQAWLKAGVRTCASSFTELLQYVRSQVDNQQQLDI